MNIKRCKTCGKSFCRWRAEARIYKELKNPVWILERSFAENLILISESLPQNEQGIPVERERKFSGCILFNCKNVKLKASQGVILLYNDNVIELKLDKGRAIENAILNSAPNDIYKEICGFI